jgi:transposase
LKDLGKWLIEKGVTHIAMESTGIYWKPVYNILEADFEVVLVNARHIKNVPGHKTDKKDSNWIAKLLLSGLLKGSFIPPREIRELRDMVRYKRKLTALAASERNRLIKVLEDANIKLSAVMSDVFGVSAGRIIDALIAGENNTDELMKHCNYRLRTSRAEIKEAITGTVTQHHRFMLGMIKKSVSNLESLIAEVETQIDIAAQKFSVNIELLQTIPGIGKTSAIHIIAEMGVDMNVFPNEHHLSSWVGVSPGNNESAGKKKGGSTTHGNKYLQTALVECAWSVSRSKGTFFHHKYHSLAARRGKKRALIAVAHKLIVTMYHVLNKQEAYRPTVINIDNKRKNRQVRSYIEKLKELGVDLEIKKAM